MVRNNGSKHGPVKAYIHIVEDQITREAAIESARIIIDRQIIVNCQIMMLVIIVDKLIAELQRRRHVIGMDTVR